VVAVPDNVVVSVERLTVVNGEVTVLVKVTVVGTLVVNVVNSVSVVDGNVAVLTVEVTVVGTFDV
jgi:hypothetical protein